MYGSHHLEADSNKYTGRADFQNSLSLESLNSYVEIIRETERRLDGMIFDRLIHAVIDVSTTKAPA